MNEKPTLTVFLNALIAKKPDAMVYLGTERGSGFVEVLPAKKLPAALANLSVSAYKLAKKREANGSTAIVRARKKYGKRSREYRRAVKYTRQAHTDLLAFKPFAKRTVVECRARIPALGGIAVIVEGGESGNYWTVEEKQKTPDAQMFYTSDHSEDPDNPDHG